MYGGVADAFAGLVGAGSGAGGSDLEVESGAGSPDMDSEDGDSEDRGCGGSTLVSIGSVARGSSRGPSQPS